MFKLPGRYQGIEGIGTALGAGVIVAYDSNNEALKTVAETLVSALGDESIAARAQPDDPNDPADNPKIIEIAIGTKPLFLREIEEIFPLPPKAKD
jgi:hypothetical protein